MEWFVPILLLTALAAPGLTSRLAHRAGAALALVPAGIAVYAALAQSAVARGEIDTFRTPWISDLGIDWAFRLDGLANLFVLLIAGIGSLVVLYSSGYLRGNPRLGRFLATLFVFMAAMLGIATADDLYLLFVFWEMTTVSSFLLIGFQSDRETARQAARQSLLVTGLGGLSLLTGILLLTGVAGTSSISEILERGDLIRAHPAYHWILGLVLLGAFAKSAQVPLHFWLPAAMQAPTPVSAYLHSSTMVKAGVFLLARLSPALGGTEAWEIALGITGTLTMVGGALGTLAQDDLKRILAFSTISVLGLLTLLVGLGTPVAARAFAVTLLAHALYKGTLFLVAGNVDHATGTRSLRELGGLRPALPWTAAAALVAGISMAGAPPLFGFLAKETAYEAVLEAPRWSWAFGPAAVLTAVCLVYAALRVGFQAFSGEPRGTLRGTAEPTAGMRVGPVALAFTGLLAGVLVGPAERAVIAPAASAILQESVPTGLALWHGFTPILALSAATVAAGLGLYRCRARVTAIADRLSGLPVPTAHGLWEGAWNGLLDFGRWQTGILQNGSLRRYIAVTMTTAFVATALSIAQAGIPTGPAAGPPVSLVGAAAAGLVIGGSVMILTAAAPLVAVAGLGAVGFGVASIFLVYSAPDLALTQLVVEVLTVVLLVFVLRRLPRPRRIHWRRVPPGAVALAAVGGGTLAALTWLAFQVHLADPISGYFGEQSVPGAHGRNVVNVILVDFRALDTLGEIVVLATAALGVLALLLYRRRGARAEASR